MLLQDNAHTHSAIRVRQFLAQKRVAVLDHPPYFPDLAPADFFLFPRLKAAIKGALFVDVNAIKDCVTAVLRWIPQEAFADCFWRPYERCQMFVLADRDYFEGQQRKFVCIFCFLIGFTEKTHRVRKISNNFRFIPSTLKAVNFLYGLLCPMEML